MLGRVEGQGLLVTSRGLVGLGSRVRAGRVWVVDLQVAATWQLWSTDSSACLGLPRSTEFL